MILVNTKLKYPAAARALLEQDDAVALGDITRQTWPDMTDARLTQYADYLMGTCGGIVTCIYEVKRWSRTTIDDVIKLVFTVAPALDLADLIGRPQPGGPWRRGEARGTRCITTQDYLDELLPETGPSLDRNDTWRGAVARVARTILDVPGTQHTPNLTVQPDGTVVVTVTAGTPVLVRSLDLSESPRGVRRLETLGRLESCLGTRRRGIRLS
jgi:hypothetical protein